MAKSPWILYGASGKVGNIVLQKNNGQTIIREHVEIVKNPRSDAQQTQRMKNTTVMAAYSTLKPICDHSFEGVSNGAKCMQYFLKKNYSVLNGVESPAYNLRLNKSLMPNPFLISEGSIRPFVANSKSNDNKFVMTFPGSPDDIATMTVQKFHDLMGIEVGDQITIVLTYTDNSSAVYNYGGIAQTESLLKYARYIFDPAKASQLAFNSEDLTFNYNALAPESVYSEMTDTVNSTINSSSPNLGFGISFTPTNTSGTSNVQTGAVIISKKSTNGWLRSTSSLYIIQGWMSPGDPLKSYSPSAEKYLNNAVV
jgi:hypothetical protein